MQSKLLELTGIQSYLGTLQFITEALLWMLPPEPGGEGTVSLFTVPSCRADLPVIVMSEFIGGNELVGDTTSTEGFDVLELVISDLRATWGQRKQAVNTQH